jgi:pyruvate-formate lyase-activating enzyme
MSKEVRQELVKYIQGINIDLKCFNDETYKKLGGRLEPVKQNIKFFFENVITEVTTLIIPEMNDSPEELRQIAEFLALISRQIPWHISAFHPDYKRQNVERTSDKTLKMAHQIAKEAGLVNVYTGNSLESKEDTFCQCGELLVKRNQWKVKFVNKECKCGLKVYGLFE